MPCDSNLAFLFVYASLVSLSCLEQCFTASMLKSVAAETAIPSVLVTPHLRAF